ncbi:unnamed protein product [Symbiodinium necroappetens]|uniref:Uncharacterized protein n=1 Tax=Symbiodinium necroappetens TaxID=1628268 RepID=A0A812WNC1_9DINO|nr:unnamed protein product [Symbiodinium necroappetens]
MDSACRRLVRLLALSLLGVAPFAFTAPAPARRGRMVAVTSRAADGGRDYTEDLNQRTLVLGVIFLVANIYAFSPMVPPEARRLKVCVYDKEYEREFLSDPSRNTQGLAALQDEDCLPLGQVLQKWLPQPRS